MSLSVSPTTTMPEEKAIVEPIEDNSKADDELAPNGAEQVISAYAGWPASKVIKKFWRLYLRGVLVTFAGIYVGYTNSIPGSIVGNPGFVKQFGTVVSAAGVVSLDANYVGLWGALKFVAQVVTQAISPITANRFGLRFNLWVLTVLKLIAIIVEIISTTWWHFLIASIFAGLSSGFVGTSVTTYASEIAMPQMRGAALSAYAFSFALGQLAAAIGLQIIAVTTPYEFRKAFYSQFAILGVWLAVLVFLPESPVWLHKKGKVAEAHRSRQRLVGRVEGYDEEREYQVMAQEIQHSMKQTQQSSQYSWVACLKGTNLRRTLISTIPLSMQASANFVNDCTPELILAELCRSSAHVQRGLLLLVDRP
ncbi:hypothetical protein EHS25_005909 [Saitozyma podzolica]|uniref:Major facilitator superfamily (MFS) profile domain-containing protein n=1 Tax=Saitozyma podzolica TaxID=1890683 RepID=A0A427XVL0_9TREE|nr:hypothetical protein EHS25_005909 [Saitozyma podzolica]